MAMFDRLREATKPTNSIEAVQPAPAPEPGRQEPRLSQPSAAAPAATETPAPAPAQTAPKRVKLPAYASEPEAISRAYYVEERGPERRYFDDYKKTALAIRADDTSINSKREDLNTIRAMLTMSEARGWSEVKISGTAEFKREAWIEAAARDITAQGYKAGDLDRQEADRRRTERRPDVARSAPSGSNEVRQAVPAPQPGPDATQPAPRQAPATGEATQARPAPEPTVSRPVRLEVVAGQETAAPASDKPTQADHRRAVREAEAVLSDNGKLMLAALSDNIDRKMNKLNADAKAEMKAFAAGELVKKERTDGPIVLTKEQIELAKAPERERAGPKVAEASRQGPAQVAETVAADRPVEAPKVVRQGPEPEQDRPRRTRSR